MNIATRPETEKPEQPKPKPGLSPQGIRAIQGQPETKDTQPPAIPDDQNFQDAKGHDLAIRTCQNGDSYMVRAFDREKTPKLPDHPTFGDAGEDR